jgi:hypothetical protein
MTIKQCDDRYGFGCKNQIEFTNEDELAKMFYKKQGYFLNTCIECHRKNTRDRWRAGDYNYKKNSNKIVDKEDYGTLGTTSKTEPMGD